MKKSQSVTFSVDEPASSDGGQPSGAKPTKMRYSQILESIAGSVGGSEVSPTPISLRAFDSSAQPAKPAMKHATGAGSSSSHIRSTDIYPSVLDSPTQAAPTPGYSSRQQDDHALSAATQGGLAPQFSTLGPDHPSLMPPSSAPCGCITRVLPGARSSVTGQYWECLGWWGAQRSPSPSRGITLCCFS